MKPLYLFLLYLIVVNIVLFLMMGIDKRLAIRQKRRIAESTLFFFCLIGGSLGGLAGMYCFRHKTKHLSFAVGFPVIFTVHLILLFLLFRSTAQLL